MRIDRNVQVLVLAALLGSGASACQREEIPSPKADVVAPAMPGDRLGAGDENRARPGARDAHEPQRIPARQRGLTAA